MADEGGNGTFSWKSAVELFSVILSLSFLASAVFFYLVFWFWGQNYFFIATPEDVVLGGLFLLMSSSSSLIFVLASEFRTVWNLKVGLGLGLVSFIASIGANVYWYRVHGSHFPGLVYVIPFEYWTSSSVAAGIVSLAALFYARAFKRQLNMAVSDLSLWTSSPHRIVALVCVTLAIMGAVGDQARTRGFLTASAYGPKLAESGCPKGAPALWAGARFTIVRCNGKIIAVGTADVLFRAADD